MVDLAFIVDSSGSISRRNWVRMKAFIKAITSQFDIGPDTGHVAIISYSTRAKIELKFNKLRGSELTTDNVNAYVDKMSHQRGFTYIDRALRLAERQVFTVAAGMRPNVAKVIWKIISNGN